MAQLLFVALAMGVAGLFGRATSTVMRSRLDTTAVLLADARLEQLRALSWGYGSAFAPSPTTDRVTNLSPAESDATGSGLSDAPSGAIDTDTAGFVDYLDDRGRWVASTGGPPAACRFIRRWSIRATDSADLLLLRVRVVDRRGEIPDVLLTALRARTTA